MGVDTQLVESWLKRHHHPAAKGSKSCVHIGTICQGASGPRSSKNTVRAVRTGARSPQRSHSSLRHTPTRPLLRHHRQYQLRIAPSRGTNRAARSSQTSRVHTHQRLAWSVFSSWDSDRRSGRPAHGIRWRSSGKCSREHRKTKSLPDQ